MKKILSALMCILLCLSFFTACSKGTRNSESDIVEPTPEPTPVYNPAFLTGLPKDADYDNEHRIIGVMVNNLSAARPQRGISQAEVLIESKVEGGITRFMALFQDYTKVDGDIGPVRSGRDQFLQLAMPLNAFYFHIGRSGVTQTYINTYEYNDSDVDGSNYVFWYRDQARKKLGYATEHTAFATPKLIKEVFEKNSKKYDTEYTYSSPWLDFVNYNDYENGIRPMEGVDALSIAAIHSMSYKTYFYFNEETGEYEMSMYNGTRGGVQKTIDENNDKQLSFENVIVLFADIEPYYYPGGNLDKNGRDKGDPDYQKVDYLSGGFGYYFSEGKMEEFTWQKGEAISMLKLFNKVDGGPLKINCGKSYVTIIDYDEFKNFAYSRTGEDLSGGKYIPSAATKVTGSAEKEMGEDVADYEMSPSPSPTVSPSPTPTRTPTPEPTATPEPSEEPTPTQAPTPEPTQEPTPAPATPEPTPEPTQAPTPAPATPAPTPEPTPAPATPAPEPPADPEPAAD